MDICDHLRAVEDTPKPDGGGPACIEAGDNWAWCIEHDVGIAL